MKNKLGPSEKRLRPNEKKRLRPSENISIRCEKQQKKWVMEYTLKSELSERRHQVNLVDA